MPIDPRIPLMGSAPNTTGTIMDFAQSMKQNRRADEALEIQKQNAQSANELRQVQLDNARFEGLDARNQSKVRSLIQGAAMLKPYLDSGDTAGAEAFLNQRLNNLNQRIGMGENLDTADTERALELLQKDPESLKKMIDGNIAAGQQLGFLKSQEQNKGFTLGYGQRRYDSQGNLIAEGADKPKGGVVASVNPGTGEITYVEPKAMPASALKLQNEELDALGTANAIQADLNEVVSMIEDGKLELGPLDNLISSGRNFSGNSNENSRNYATFQATLEKMRNDSLRLNKGVQTEGDAQRAWNEVMKNVNDVELVKKRLNEIGKINERAANLRKLNIDNIRSNYGQPKMDYSKYDATPAIGGGAKQESESAPQSNQSQQIDLQSLSDDELLKMLQ